MAYAASYLARITSCNREQHWKEAKQVLRYLQHTKNMEILYEKCKSKRFDINTAITAYVDSDYNSDVVRRRFTTGVVIHFMNAPINWFSRRQNFTAQSSMEAEYAAAATCGKEVVWIRRFFEELEYDFSNSTMMFTDNEAAIKLAKNPAHHEAAKHIEQIHYIRDLLDDQVIKLNHHEIQPADILAKSLPKTPFMKTDLMGVRQLPEKEDDDTIGKRSTSVAFSSVAARKLPLIMRMPISMMTLTPLSIFSIIFQGGFAQEQRKLQQGDPVIWRQEDTPIITGLTEVQLTLELISPCSLLPKDQVPKKLIEECERCHNRLVSGRITQHL